MVVALKGRSPEGAQPRRLAFLYDSFEHRMAMSSPSSHERDGACVCFEAIERRHDVASAHTHETAMDAENSTCAMDPGDLFYLS